MTDCARGLRITRVFDQADAIAQPLDGSSGDEHAALERVFDPTADRPRDRRNQPATRNVRVLGAGVHQQKTTGPVGVLRKTGLRAALPKSAAC